MKSLKAKEPLVAVILSFFLAGWGQVYVGRVRRGCLFCVVFAVFLFGSLSAVFHPGLKLNKFFLVLIPVFFLLKFYIAFDAYICARNYNIINSIQRKKNILKTIGMIMGVFLFSFVNMDASLGYYIRENVVHPFKITAGGMSPALFPKYRVLVDKSVYRRSQPARGDIIVFKHPKRKGNIHVNRIAGLPGEIIEIKKGKLFINGKKPEGSDTLSSIYYLYQGGYGRKGHPFTIPEGNYFALGDNSRTSYDSRHWGPLPREALIGKVYKVYFPFHKSGPVKK